MTFQQKLGKEMREVALTTLYFAVCFGVLVALKRLYLAEYQIKFRGLSLAIVSALIVAKVVLLMEHVTLGQWIHSHAAALGVILRTLLYTFGVAVALLLEKGFDVRHEHGGVGASVARVLQHRHIHHAGAATLVVACGPRRFKARW